MAAKVRLEKSMRAKTPYKDWLVLWLEDKRKYVKMATYGTYASCVFNHIIPALGSYSISSIDESLVQEQILCWLSSGRLNQQGGLAEKTVRDMWMIVRTSLRDSGCKLRLPIESWAIRFPHTGRPRSPHVMSLPDLHRLTKAIHQHPNNKNIGILLALHTGMRIGELCALQWRDIDLCDQTISITKTLQRVYTKDTSDSGRTEIILGRPKSKSAERIIPITSHIASLLGKAARKESLDYLLTGHSKYVEPRNYRKYYQGFLAKHGIAHINFHGLRHTFATRLIEAGADPKTVSELLGHSTVNTTLNLYVHPQLEQKRSCVALMQRYLVDQ